MNSPVSKNTRGIGLLMACYIALVAPIAQAMSCTDAMMSDTAPEQHTMTYSSKPCHDMPMTPPVSDTTQETDCCAQCECVISMTVLTVSEADVKPAANADGDTLVRTLAPITRQENLIRPPIS